MEDIMISVICNTYNQDSYIRDALNGFVMQKTNFKFEVLVHDDASTDNTPKIIKEFEEKYPDIIKPIYQKENQYSKNVPITKVYGYSRACGKYIALCEGDDYWTDVNKLQKQFDILESRPEIDMCAHSANIVYADNPKKVKQKLQPSKNDRVLSTEEVVIGGGGYLATNSLMFKKSLFEDEPPFRKLLNLDYTLQILGSLNGGIYFLSENMSNYRFLAKGSWTMKNKDRQSKISFRLNLINMLKQFNMDTEYKYNDSVEDAIKIAQCYIHIFNNDYKELLKKEYEIFFKKLSYADRLKIRLKAYFPCLLTIKNFLNKRR